MTIREVISKLTRIANKESYDTVVVVSDWTLGTLASRNRAIGMIDYSPKSSTHNALAVIWIPED